MAYLNVQLRTESGEVRSRVDDRGILRSFIPPLDEESSPCLRFIDPYGDTIFNRLQAPALHAELAACLERAAEHERKVLTEVSNLAAICAREVHTYLWFVGD